MHSHEIQQAQRQCLQQQQRHHHQTRWRGALKGCCLVAILALISVIRAAQARYLPNQPVAMSHSTDQHHQNNHHLHHMNHRQKLSQLPPSIIPFAFNQKLRENQRAIVMCAISSGEQPISFTWLKDGQKLSETQQPHLVVVPRADSSTLMISSVRHEHAGNYSCLAQNRFGSQLQSAQLEVVEDPRHPQAAQPQASSERLQPNSVGESNLYACEERQLEVECQLSESIQLIRADYGRFSIQICREPGQLVRQVDCVSPETGYETTARRRLIKRSGISDQRLAEIQMIRALKKQLERAATKIAAESGGGSGQGPEADGTAAGGDVK